MASAFVPGATCTIEVKLRAIGSVAIVWLVTLVPVADDVTSMTGAALVTVIVSETVGLIATSSVTVRFRPTRMFCCFTVLKPDSVAVIE